MTETTVTGQSADPELASPPTNNRKPASNGFSTHMQELRRRVTISFAAVVICSGGAYAFAKPIAHYFMTPLFLAYPDLAGLVYTNLTEAFFAYLKLSILVGLIVSFPILAYQTWMYVAPGLKKKEKKTVLLVVSIGTVLFSIKSSLCRNHTGRLYLLPIYQTSRRRKPSSPRFRASLSSSKDFLSQVRSYPAPLLDGSGLFSFSALHFFYRGRFFP
jgi:hypothetical protein